MKFLANETMSRFFNIGLRLISLGTKLLLTLYIARYLNLTAMGYFGLVNAVVFILMVVLGVNLSYVVSRELVGASPLDALTKMRDQAVLYLINQTLLAIAMLMGVWVGLIQISPKILFVIYVLSILENWGDTLFLNFISMGRPLVANLLFFIRTAFWVFPVIGLGLLWPEFRTPEILFSAWGLGGLGCVALALYLWRDLPWRQVLQTPIGWGWIQKSVRLCFLIWIGSLGGTLAYFVDRFVLAENMTLELVGVATFYSSFGGALFALIHSGVLSFSYPRLITLFQEKNKTLYINEVRKVAWQVAILAGFIGIIIGIAVPALGDLFGRPELVAHAPTLWLILLATWLRCNSETLYYVLFSQHKDGALWKGGLLYLIPSLGCNLILVPLIGFSGIGYSAVISGLFLLIWRGWHVYKNDDPASPLKMQPEP